MRDSQSHSQLAYMLLIVVCDHIVLYVSYRTSFIIQITYTDFSKIYILIKLKKIKGSALYHQPCLYKTNLQQ